VRNKDWSTEALLKQIYENPPKLHRPKDFNPADQPDAEDGLVGWGIQESFLRLLVRSVTIDSLTLETGSGLSTVCLAVIGTEHICISPAEKEHNRIRRYCQDHDISTQRIRFIPKRSDAVLPTLDLGGRKLDFALLDGSHAFPDPIIDYFFVNERLKVGGLLAIDDLNISSVGILQKFLVTEPAYQLVEIDGLKTGLYRKIRETSYPRGWEDQDFNAKYPDFSYLAFPARVRVKFQPAEYKLRTALGGIPGVRPVYHWFKNRFHRETLTSSNPTNQTDRS
jgi:hypothetical protein